MYSAREREEFYIDIILVSLLHIFQVLFHHENKKQFFQDISIFYLNLC